MNLLTKIDFETENGNLMNEFMNRPNHRNEFSMLKKKKDYSLHKQCTCSYNRIDFTKLTIIFF